MEKIENKDEEIKSNNITNEKQNNNIDKKQYLFNFIDSEFKNLIQLYIKERQEKLLGILQIIGVKKENKIDVMYLKIDDLNDKIKKIVIEKEKKCLFLVFDNENPDDYFITEYKL